VKLVVGLGNPGARYRDTRHNIGFLVVDALAREAKALPVDSGAPAEVRRALLAPDPEGVAEEVLLVKPLTYMNRSGLAVAEVVREVFGVTPDDILVVLDDLYLDFGRLRLRGSGSDGGHNGLKSIEATLGSREYPRLKCGIGPQPAGVPAEEFVLGEFSVEEVDGLPGFVGRAADAARAFVAEGLVPAMNRFNR
jgi:PTH1 family peptidyl-tRNA hydrolase